MSDRETEEELAKELEKIVKKLKVRVTYVWMDFPYLHRGVDDL